MELRTVDSKTFDEHIAAGGSGFAVMGIEGDTKTIWDPNNADEVDVAREQYDTLKRKGYSAFRVDDKGEKTTKMTEFDRNAGKVIFVKPVVGG